MKGNETDVENTAAPPAGGQRDDTEAREFQLRKLSQAPVRQIIAELARRPATQASPETARGTSQAKVEANKRNAAKSTGPRTEPGRTRSRMNAVTHGLTAEAVVAPWEVGEDFDAFRARLLDALAPVGGLDAMLAERVIVAAWRMRRAVEAEAATLADEHADREAWYARFPPDRRAVTAATLVTNAWCRSVQRVALISRYEGALERGMFQAIHELQRLQATRAGIAAPPPLALDVNVSADPAGDP